MKNITNTQQEGAKYAKYNLADAIAKRTEFIRQLNDLMPLALGKTTMLSAQGGVGKTFLALKCALTVVKNPNEKVLMHLSEDDLGEIKIRADKLCENQLLVSHLKNVELNDASVIIQKELFTANKRELLCKRFAGYKLIILDPLIGFINFNENDNTAAKEFIANLNYVALTNNQAILLLHHHRKQSSKEETETIVRGASAFIDAVRVHYSLHYDSNTKQHIIKIEKDNLNVRQFFNNNEDTKKIQIFPNDGGQNHIETQEMQEMQEIQKKQNILIQQKKG